MFKVAEILKATQGKLIKGRGNTPIRGVSIDSRTISEGSVFIAIKGDNFDGHDFIEQAIKKGAAAIIKEAKNNKRLKEVATVIEVKDSQRALGDIAHFWRKKFAIPVIAITGSNGKTTAKEMVACVLSKKYRVLKNEGTKNNQIGLPLTLLKLNAGYDMAVLELGTNHFGEIAYLSRIASPNIGVITNIAASHLEYLRDLSGVFKEKYTLINNLRGPAIAILNADDGFLKNKIMHKIRRPFILGYGIKNQNDFFATDVKQDGCKLDFRVNLNHRFELKALGFHNIYNALIAIAVARVFGLGYNEIYPRLKTFVFPDSRLRLIKIKNTTFIDDTYNSNPGSLKQALEALDKFRTSGRKIFIMGDMLELGKGSGFYHAQAANDISRACDIFIAVGELSKLTSRSLRSCGFNRQNIFSCACAQEAGDILRNKLGVKHNDIILVKGSRMMKMEEVFK